jgi:hypothetical protein
MFAEILERLREAAPRGVERLVHRREIRRVQTFEADEHSLAAAEGQQFKELLVVGRIDTRLANPTDAEGDEGAKEGLRLREVRGDVVIHEEKQFFLAFDGPSARRRLNTRDYCSMSEIVCGNSDSKMDGTKTTPLLT